MEKIAVIGAGIAGLNCAYQLSKHRFDVDVFEKNGSVGGRMKSDKSNGFIIDTGAQFFYDAYKNTFNLCKELGIEKQLVKFLKPYGIYRGGKIYKLNSPKKDPFSLLKSPVFSFKTKIKLFKILPVLILNYKRLDLNNPQKRIIFDNMTVSEYIKKNFNEEFFDYFAQPLVAGLTLGEPDELSLAVFLGGMKHQIFSNLYCLRDGMDVLPKTLADRLKVHLNSEIKKIIFEKDKAVGIEYDDMGSIKSKEYSSIVVATTADKITKIAKDMPEEFLDFFKEVKYSTSATVFFGSKSKFLPDIYALALPKKEGFICCAFSENTHKMQNISDIDAGLLACFPISSYGKELINEDDENIIKKIEEELMKVFNQLNILIFRKVYKWEQALPQFPPGYIKRAWEFKNRTGIKGIFFAGDYLMTPSVEGALTSGNIAAEKVLKYLGGIKR